MHHMSPVQEMLQQYVKKHVYMEENGMIYWTIHSFEMDLWYICVWTTKQMEWEIQAYHKNNKNNTVSLGQVEKLQKKSRSPTLHKRWKKRFKEKELANNNSGNA